MGQRSATLMGFCHLDPPAAWRAAILILCLAAPDGAAAAKGGKQVQVDPEITRDQVEPVFPIYRSSRFDNAPKAGPVPPRSDKVPSDKAPTPIPPPAPPAPVPE
ncbi:MAG: hypothetical protein PHU21_07135, partial [Elusimicrobia bacterium]|nr:hypothetical protein [Elusimicrobiota bacterium]